MDDATHNKKKLPNSYLKNGEQRIHDTTAGKNPTQGVLRQHESTQMLLTGKGHIASTALKSRGKHAILESEDQELMNFAPFPRQLDASVQEPLLNSKNSKTNANDEDTEVPSLADESSMSTFARQSSSLTHIQECEEVPPHEPYQDVHCSDANTLVQSPYNNEEARSSSPVHHQSVSHGRGTHDNSEVPLGVDEDICDEHMSGTSVVTSQHRHSTVHIAEGSSPSLECPASRLSSTSTRSIDSTAKRPHSRNARVNKTSTTVALSPRTQKSCPSPTTAPSRVPTEEDLLLLLMHRQRVRKHDYNLLLNDIHHIQAENEHLQRAELDREAELADTKSRWHDALKESHIREADIRAFGEKYDKLKTWARDMHDAFASTRTESSRLNDEIMKLKTEKEDQIKERSELLEKIEGISKPMRKFKETIADLRATSIKLQTTQDLLDQARKEVQDEKLTNKTHTLRIQKLESNQQLVDSQLTKQQDEMQNSLSLVSGLLQKNDNRFLHKIVAELTDVMQKLQKDVATKEESATQFSSLLDMTKQNHAELSTAINEVNMAQAECRAIQDLQEEIEQLKVKHAAELANCSKEIQRTATSLEEALSKIEAEKVTSRAIRLDKDVADKALTDRTTKCQELNEDLAVERKLVEQLREAEVKLQDKARIATDAHKRLIEEVEKVRTKEDSEKDDKTRKLIELEAQVSRLQKDTEADKVTIEKHAAKILELEETCKANEQAALQSQEDLKNARDEASALGNAVRAKDIELQNLQKRFELAEKSVAEVPRLKEKVVLQGKSIDTLSQEVKEKESQIEQIQGENSNITQESKKLVAAHKQCGEKDETIRALQVDRDELAEKMHPLSVLVERLTNEEKMALDEKVVLGIRAMIQRLHEQDRNTPDCDKDVFARPRRAANRDNHPTHEAMVVEDSQSQLPHHVAGTPVTPADSDELIDLDIGDLGPISSIRQYPDTVNDSQPVPELSNTTTMEDLRPATSNHEMLLRSSDTGSYPRIQTQGTVLVPASSYEVSPMRTRQGSQIRHGTPRPQSNADSERVVNFSTPPTYLREAHTPNSAAKRRQTSEVPESAAKRRTINMKNLETRSSKNPATPSSTPASDSDDTNYLPVGGRKSTDATGSKTASRKSKKTAPSSRKRSKSARMEAQFNAPAF